MGYRLASLPWQSRRTGEGPSQMIVWGPELGKSVNWIVLSGEAISFALQLVTAMNFALYSSATVSRTIGWLRNSGHVLVKLCQPISWLKCCWVRVFRYSPSPCHLCSQATFCSKSGCYFALLGRTRRTTLRNSQNFPNNLSGQKRSGIKLVLQRVKLWVSFSVCV